MGYSPIVFRNKCARANDLDLHASACLIADCAMGSDGLLDPALRDHVLGWINKIQDTWAPGCVDLELDEVLTSPERLTQLLHLTACAERRLDAFGEVVPAEYLNKAMDLRGVHALRDYPSNLVLVALNSIRAVLLSESTHGAP